MVLTVDIGCCYLVAETNHHKIFHKKKVIYGYSFADRHYISGGYAESSL